MIVEAKPNAVRKLVQQQRSRGAVVGVVPTMGALHAGHVSLIEAARASCDFVVATVFVNPTQFGPNEDFGRYPRTLEDDLGRCKNADADLVFTPDTSDMYLPDAETTVRVNKLTTKLEGAMRPGHFDGVTTIVAKLFNVTVPDRAYFGQKDYQQQLVIKRMVRDLDWGIEVVTCPIIREPDGLAMSSRNRYLSPEDRQRALVLQRALRFAADRAENSVDSAAEIQAQMRQMISSTDGVELDYAVIVDTETLENVDDRPATAAALVAAKLGETRLIDNQILRFRPAA